MPRVGKMRTISRSIAVLIGLVISGSSGASMAAPFPGPDAFGYTATAVGGNLRNVSSTGTFVSLWDDQTSGAIPIGFDFKFYGKTYSSVYISSNGFMAFTPEPNGCCSGHPLPSSSSGWDPDNLVAGFWEDLNVPTGNIRYQTLGAAGNRTFVVGFYGVQHFANGPAVTFEMILHEGSNEIELQYGHAPSDGGTHSVGIENADGTIGLQIAHGNVSFSNEGFLIAPGTKAIAEAPNSANEGMLGVPLDGSASVDDPGGGLTYFWEQIAIGDYAVGIHDPSAPVTSIDAPYVTENTTLSFRLTVTDTEATTSSDTVSIAIVDVNTAPVADAGDDQDGAPGNLPAVPEGAEFTLDGTSSYDAESDPLTCDWHQTQGSPTSVTSGDPGDCIVTWRAPSLVPVEGELLTFDLVVHDGQQRSLPDSVNVLVTHVNQPPTAAAALLGGGTTRDEFAEVELDGSGSSDPEADPLTFAWEQVSGSVAVDLFGTSVSNVSFTAPPVGPGGEDYAFRLTVGDGEFTDTTDVTVHVANFNDPPNCDGAVPSVAKLWPPKHELVDVGITNLADPNNNPVAVSFAGVTQDEPTNGLGDGDTTPDAVVGSLGESVMVRSERAGGGDGRVYVIDFTADDGYESCSGTVSVTVPPNRKGSDAVDSGQNHDSTL